MRANQEITERKLRSREEIKRLVSEFEASGAPTGRILTHAPA